jgi:hypothetical protein
VNDLLPEHEPYVIKRVPVPITITVYLDIRVTPDSYEIEREYLEGRSGLAKESLLRVAGEKGRWQIEDTAKEAVANERHNRLADRASDRAWEEGQ